MRAQYRFSPNTFNKSYEGYRKFTSYNTNVGGEAKEGDIIVEKVGIVKSRPKVEHRLGEFVKGAKYETSTGMDRIYLGTMYHPIFQKDVAVWGVIGTTSRAAANFTNTDGSAVAAGFFSIARPVDEVCVGEELYVEEIKE